MPFGSLATGTATRFRVLSTRLFGQVGLRPEAFLVLVAVLIGLVTSAASVGFHELIVHIRNALYQRFGEQRLYGPWMFMLIVWPALGGIVVGVISHYIAGVREGHGVVDVIESVIRS